MDVGLAVLETHPNGSLSYASSLKQNSSSSRCAPKLPNLDVGLAVLDRHPDGSLSLAGSLASLLKQNSPSFWYRCAPKLPNLDVGLAVLETHPGGSLSLTGSSLPFLNKTNPFWSRCAPKLPNMDVGLAVLERHPDGSLSLAGSLASSVARDRTLELQLKPGSYLVVPTSSGAAPGMPAEAEGSPERCDFTSSFYTRMDPIA